MPRYCYTTEDGETVERAFPMAKRPAQIKLDDGRIACYDFAATASEVKTTPPGCWPMKSASMGVLPTQIADATAEANNLGVPTEFCKRTGDAIFRDRRHRRDFLRSQGMHDQDGGYGD